LGLFFTKGNSLNSWVKSGLFDREKKIYEFLIERGYVESVLWFTYGKNDDVLADELKEKKKLHEKIIVVSMPKKYDSKIGQWFYSFFIVAVHFFKIKKIDVLKTNQIYGSWAPLIIKMIMSKPLMVRCGFVPTRNTNYGIVELIFLKIIQRLVFKFADISVVSNHLDHAYITNKYKLKNVKINPSYVDTSLFFRGSSEDFQLADENRFLFVGRLEEIKNIINTIDAVLLTGNSIDIYGSGTLENYIRKKYKNQILDNKVVIMGSCPNDILAKKLRCYKFYILISKIEGMSKSLIEAMASGLICLVSDIPENTNMIIDGDTGIVVNGFSVEAIKNKINCISSYDLEYISENCSKYVVENYNLEVIAKNEIENINAIIR